MIADSIRKFISDQTCATICCIEKENEPYCFNCFFAFDPEEASLLFKSSPDSHHSELMRNNHFVAGTIVPDKLNKLKIKGIQFRGVAIGPDHPLCRKIASSYYKKFPLALAMPGEIWTIRLSHIKMTDNTLTFGKKVLWTRAEEKVHAA